MSQYLDLFPIDGRDLLKVAWLYGAAPSAEDISKLLRQQDRSIDKEMFLDWVSGFSHSEEDSVESLISIIEDLKLVTTINGRKYVPSKQLQRILQIGDNALATEEYVGVASKFSHNGLVDLYSVIY